MVAFADTSQSCGLPIAQYRHLPQHGIHETTTVSPTAMSVTPSPTSTIVPAASCPSTTGGGSGIVPFVAERSLWHTPHAPIFTITSPRFGDSTWIVSTTTGLFHSRQRTAFDCLPIRDLLGRGRGAARAGMRGRPPRGPVI